MMPLKDYYHSLSIGGVAGFAYLSHYSLWAVVPLVVCAAACGAVHGLVQAGRDNGGDS